MKRINAYETTDGTIFNDRKLARDHQKQIDILNALRALAGTNKNPNLDFALNTLGEFADKHGKPAFIMGEVFGKTLGGAGVQDLTYTDEPLDFRAFDVCIGNRGNETYLPFDEFVDLLDAAEIPRVPVLYVGPYSKDVVLQHTDGNTTLAGSKHIREGVVVKSYYEARNPHYGRKTAKSVSEAYLLRKGNVTEFN